MKMNRVAIICGFLMLAVFSVSANSLERKAEQGDARAQYELGKRCSDKKNYRCALVWLQKAGEQGHAGAQNRLGVMYERGEGVMVDLVEAYKWYSLSAAAGNSFASANRASLESHLTREQIASTR